MAFVFHSVSDCVTIGDSVDGHELKEDDHRSKSLVFQLATTPGLVEVTFSNCAANSGECFDSFVSFV